MKDKDHLAPAARRTLGGANVAFGRHGSRKKGDGFDVLGLCSVI
jgi:hypothetical protein